MSIPIWVTDPAGNNNPYLKIVSKTKFVFWQQASFDGNGVVTLPALMWWSDDAVTWTQASLPASVTGHPGLRAKEIVYKQGTWIAHFEWTYAHDMAGDPLGTDGWLFTSDGKNWTCPLDTSTGVNVGQTYDFNNNQWLLFALTPPNTLVPVPNPFPLNNGNPTMFADPITAIPFMTLSPTQPAAASHPTLVLQNALPSGAAQVTAVRYLFDVAATETFEYTTDTITNAIVSSGAFWPAANWITSPSWNAVVALQPSTNSSTGGNISYGQTGGA